MFYKIWTAIRGTQEPKFEAVTREGWSCYSVTGLFNVNLNWR